MFLCRECCDDIFRWRFDIPIALSWGPCEGCGKTAKCTEAPLGPTSSTIWKQHVIAFFKHGQPTNNHWQELAACMLASREEYGLSDDLEQAISAHLVPEASSLSNQGVSGK